MTYLLWIIQILLALLFLFTGGLKLVIPADKLTAMNAQNQVQMSVLFLRFIGAMEILGALGLILPGLMRIKPGLTPLAAACLVVIMIGATVVTLANGTIGPAIFPFVAGLLAALVAYGRWRLAPQAGRR
ncbi:MAG TPA: DoxX family protein [Pyrinomonadaceae bacterium]|nr:DoxX family protein [Pyrinomonadaceae bacterium]